MSSNMAMVAGALFPSMQVSSLLFFTPCQVFLHPLINFLHSTDQMALKRMNPFLYWLIFESPAIFWNFICIQVHYGLHSRKGLFMLLITEKHLVFFALELIYLVHAYSVILTCPEIDTWELEWVSFYQWQTDTGKCQYSDSM